MRAFSVLVMALSIVLSFAMCGQQSAPATQTNQEQKPAVQKVEPAKQQAATEQTTEAQPADTTQVQDKPAEPKKSAYNTTKDLDWSITPERRTAIETAIPDAKDFIDGNAIVKEIIEKGIKPADERKKLFAEKAKDKFVYFSGQTNPNPFNANASLNLIFGEGGLMPDFMMVQLKAPKDFDNKKYLELHGGTGYVTAFIGKLIDTENMTLDPCYDVYLPGYLK